jgi:DNA polymerase III delta prime subunit
MPYFPFEKLGLHRNPFGTLEPEAWSDLGWLHPQLLHALDAGTPVIELLGKPGSGKTSALLALKRELEQRGKAVRYIYLEPGIKPPAIQLEEGHVLLLDEIERLGARSRRRLLTSASSQPAGELKLSFSSHHTFEHEFEDAKGEHWKTLTLPSIDAAQLQSLLNARIGAFTLQETMPVWITRSGAEELLTQFAVDLRRMERALYEAFQVLDKVGALDRDELRRLLALSGGPPGPG